MRDPLSPADIVRIRQAAASGMSPKTLARAYCRSIETIRRILRRETFDSVPAEPGARQALEQALEQALHGGGEE